MSIPEWIQAFPGEVTVCDENGIILAMNDRSAAGNAKHGGRDLIGKDIMACHPKAAAAVLSDLLANPRLNAYTTERKGLRKQVYQAPWYTDGKFSGIVELVLELPPDMPHFVRQP